MINNKTIMKYLFGILLVGLLVIPLLPTMVSAAPATQASGCTIRVRAIELSDPAGTFSPGAFVGDDNVRWGLICTLNTINIVTNWIFIGLVAIAVFLVLMGAFKLMTAGGNTANVSAGRNYIMYAAIGLLVALVARAVPSLVQSLLG